MLICLYWVCFERDLSVDGWEEQKQEGAGGSGNIYPSE